MASCGYRGEGLREQQKGFTKEYTDTCSDAYVYYLDFGDCFKGIYICQITKLYILNTCNVLYVSCTSIKL